MKASLFLCKKVKIGNCVSITTQAYFLFLITCFTVVCIFL
ncbi:protein of unknown function [Tenacibaculum aestuariivivum]